MTNLKEQNIRDDYTHNLYTHDHTRDLYTHDHTRDLYKHNHARDLFTHYHYTRDKSRDHFKRERYTLDHNTRDRYKYFRDQYKFDIYTEFTPVIPLSIRNKLYKQYLRNRNDLIYGK